MQGFNMGRYHPPASLDTSLSNKPSAGFNRRTNGKSTQSTGPPTVRFEMPFAIWCTNCKPEQIIGQGVRFNAQKNRVGNYYTTPIWSFTMRHGACGEMIAIRTDPQAGDYVVESGGRKRNYGDQTEGSRDGVFGELLIEEERAKRAADPFASLEGRVEQGEKAKKEGWWIEKLQDQKDKDWDDVWRANQRLRKTFRVERKELQAKEANREEVTDRLGLSIDVLDEAPEDRQRAALMTFGATNERSNGDVTLSTSRPLFDQEKDPLQNVSTKGKTKSQAKVEKSKAALQQSLTSNTRAITDPFINSDTKPAVRPVLLAGIKRKRTEGPSVRLTSETVITSNMTAKDDGNMDTVGSHQQPLQSLLVAYGSDDD